jgi:hypothetical protein
MAEWIEGLTGGMRLVIGAGTIVAASFVGMTTLVVYTELPASVDVVELEIERLTTVMRALEIRAEINEEHFEELKCLVGLLLMVEPANLEDVAACSR